MPCLPPLSPAAAAAAAARCLLTATVSKCREQGPDFV